MSLNPDFDRSLWFVSSRPADRRALLQGALVVAASTLIFLIALPFVRLPGPHAPSFLPFYVASLMFCDFTTFVLLLGHFAVLRWGSILMLAAGYLFTGLMTLGYTVVFPNLFFAPELTGAGPQTTSAMYMIWHAGFPLFVLGYSILSHRETQPFAERRGRRRSAKSARQTWGLLTFVSLAAVGATGFATLGNQYLPEFLIGNTTTELGHAFLFAVWLLSFMALVVQAILKHRSYTVLDVWLMVVLIVWLFDLALAALLNTGRYDVGWYTGRFYGLLASAFLLGLLLAETSRSYGRMVHVSMELNRANHQLEKLALHDGLTGITNRRGFDLSLTRLWHVAQEQGLPLSLLLCDVDRFKDFNDSFGHQAGDDCLRTIGQALLRTCRRGHDEAARYGGEEFAVLLPGTDAAGALDRANTLRTEVLACRIVAAGSGPEPFVTVSVGVASTRPGANESPSTLLEKADRALYQAKEAGRNRVVLFAERVAQTSAPVTTN